MPKEDNYFEECHLDLRDDHKEGVGWLATQATPPRSTIGPPTQASCNATTSAMQSGWSGISCIKSI